MAKGEPAMSFQSILHEIDAQMDQLQQARNLIVNSQGTQSVQATQVAPSTFPFAPSTTGVKNGSDVPLGRGGARANSVHADATTQPIGVGRISRRPGMSEEAKRRIGEATRKRWAAKKKADKK